jgi:hypothetical protein
LAPALVLEPVRLEQLVLVPALLVQLVPEPALPSDPLLVVLVFDFDRPLKNITSSIYKLILIYHN